MLINGLTNENLPEIVQKLREGGVGVVPSDTLYGISCLTSNQAGIERIYQIKNHDLDKPFIILVSALDDIRNFGVELSENMANFLLDVWPEKLSVILDVPTDKFSYLHRGKKSLAFRIPKNELLVKLIKESGPIVSTSVNLSGQPPAKTIKEAQIVCGDQVDFYVDVGRLDSPPTTVIKVTTVGFEVVRQGEVLVQSKMLE
jgi:L-threonylcarbamoyladenylate synthase